MNQLGIWMDEQEYLCNVNEHTTCDEVIQLLIKPPTFVNEMSHSFEVNACEYKLDKLLFAKQSDGSNNSSDGSMEEKRRNIIHSPRMKSRIPLVYDSRIQELSERISLLDSTIELYDNADVEDGVSEDEIIENQVTRMGMLVKKQSSTINNLVKQQNKCLYTEKIANQRLLAELENDYSQMKMLDHQLEELQSTLDFLNWRLNKQEIKSEDFRTKNHVIACSFSPKLTRNKLTTDYDRNHSIETMTSSRQSESFPGGAHSATGISSQTLQHADRSRDTQHCQGTQRPPGSNVDSVENYEKELLTRKEILSLTLGLHDDGSSVLV